jgi:hypothetical protein
MSTCDCTLEWSRSLARMSFACSMHACSTHLRPQRHVHQLRVCARSLPSALCNRNKHTFAINAGFWKNLEVAIKTVLFQSTEDRRHVDDISNEAAIATNLAHENIVATYAHDVCDVPMDPRAQNELVIYKFYLVQVGCLAPQFEKVLSLSF